MNIPFSKSLQKKIKDEGMQKVVFSNIQKLSVFETWIKYIIDSKFNRGFDLKEWCMSQVNNPKLIKIVEEQGWKNIQDEDTRVCAILNYWQNGGKGKLIYKGDKENYGKNEYWATVQEILDKLCDDCDGFANIIYHSCKLSGIDDSRLYVVASDVIGGGHCFVVYVSNDGLEYPIDGCYWTNISLQMAIPYWLRRDYYYGEREWFRFNESGCYKQTTKLIYK